MIGKEHEQQTFFQKNLETKPVLFHVITAWSIVFIRQLCFSCLYGIKGKMVYHLCGVWEIQALFPVVSAWVTLVI